MIVHIWIHHLFVNIYTRIVPWWFVNLERFISRWINRFNSEIIKATAARTITPVIIRVIFGFVEEWSHIRLGFEWKSFLSENIQIWNFIGLNFFGPHSHRYSILVKHKTFLWHIFENKIIWHIDYYYSVTKWKRYFCSLRMTEW